MYEKQETIIIFLKVCKINSNQLKKRMKSTFSLKSLIDPLRMENSRDEVVHVYTYEDLKCIWKTSEVCIYNMGSP